STPGRAFVLALPIPPATEEERAEAAAWEARQQAEREERHRPEQTAYRRQLAEVRASEDPDVAPIVRYFEELYGRRLVVWAEAELLYPRVCALQAEQDRLKAVVDSKRLDADDLTRASATHR